MSNRGICRTAPATVQGLLKVFWLEQLDTSTTDEMYSGQRFAILQCFGVTQSHSQADADTDADAVADVYCDANRYTRPLQQQALVCLCRPR